MKQFLKKQKLTPATGALFILYVLFFFLFVGTSSQNPGLFVQWFDSYVEDTTGYALLTDAQLFFSQIENPETFDQMEQVVRLMLLFLIFFPILAYFVFVLVQTVFINLSLNDKMSLKRYWKHFLLTLMYLVLAIVPFSLVLLIVILIFQLLNLPEWFGIILILFSGLLFFSYYIYLLFMSTTHEKFFAGLLSIKKYFAQSALLLPSFLIGAAVLYLLSALAVTYPGVGVLALLTLIIPLTYITQVTINIFEEEKKKH
ncbi:MAG: hypothetical protein ACMXYF_04355 [Candidatus Woesearchaeota archaeon]